jgi:hypothetical protein
MDSVYQKVAIHRQCTKFDPSRSTNPLVIQAIYEGSVARYSNDVLMYLFNNEIETYPKKPLSKLPISYAIISHRIQNAWVDLIQQMIFRDNMFVMFVSEFSEIIENILINESIDNIDFYVYRNLESETIFHLAARVWILSKFSELITLHIPKYKKKLILEDELEYILKCYRSIGNALRGTLEESCINYISDFDDTTLEDSLYEYLEILIDKQF